MSSSTFKVELGNTRDKFLTGTGRIAQLSLFTGWADTVLGTDRGRTKYLEHRTTEEIKKYADVFPDLQLYTKQYGPREGFWRWSRGLPRKVNRSLYQHLLVFLVTIFEAFIEDVLLLVFDKEPRCLSSGREISSEKVIELGDYDSVIDHLASQKVADVLSGDWYKIVEEFKKLFNIDLCSEIDCRSIAEVFEIRHAVVHDVGRVDQRFVSKVNSSQWGISYSLDKEIVLNRQVLERMLACVEHAVDFIHDSVLSKFGAN